MDQLKFMIESSEAKNMVKKQGLNSVLELLPAIVRSTRKLARPPISGFSVSAVGLSSDGRIFTGVNIEFPGLPLHQTVHAEQFLITNLSNYPGTTLTNIVVSAYPCGHCRQFLQEIRGAQGIQLYVLNSFESEGQNVGEINECFKPLSYFLPHRFGPDDLLEKNAPLVLETRENLLHIDQSLLNENYTLKFDVKRVALAALEAANRSHAPYSGYASGVAIIDEDDNVYKGRYMESAAYNPSIGPAQAAVIAYIAATGGTGDEAESETGYGKIKGAVLVEKEGGLVRQEDTVRLFFKAVSPKCQFYVFHCKDSK